MYRIAILLGSFALAVIGLIFLQGGRDDPRVAAVTPAAELTEVTDLSAPMPGATPVAPVAARTPAPAPSSAPVAVAPAPAPSPAPAEGGEMAAMTASVLAGLGVKTTAPAPVDEAPSAGGDMRAMTSSVLAGLGLGAGAPADKELSLEEAIAAAMQAGEPDDYLDALLNEASDQGLIEVPAALRRADGGVDTTTLINTIVAAASDAPRPERRPTVGGEGVEVRMIMEAGRTVQVNFYTVQDGDSLGAIAHRFYGDAALFTEIFEANRRLLSSPELIRKGQRLTIPNLDA